MLDPALYIVCDDKIMEKESRLCVYVVRHVRSVVPVNEAEKSFEIVGFRSLRALRKNRAVVSVNGDGDTTQNT